MNRSPVTLEQMREQVMQFVHERDWEQFHNPKDVAISLSLEAAEVLEHFQWKTKKEITKYAQQNKHDIADELSDVIFNVLLLSHYLDIDLDSAFPEKMKKNAKKYPVDKVKGKHAKYTAYQDS